MARGKPTGRAKVPRGTDKAVGRAKVGRSVGKVPPVDRAHTDVVRMEDLPQPVFVDPSGARRRRLRRLSYAIGFLLLLALAGFWLSQFGGDVGPPPPGTPCSAVPGGASAGACPR